MSKNQGKIGLDVSEVVESLPMACSNETAALEFWEKHRWGAKPFCPHCGNVDVYKMVDAETGARNRRCLWRCRECKKQFTVKIGTVLEESKIPLRHWCYALWRSCTSKKGCAALEIKRHTGLSYKSSLFLMHRLRHAMADNHGPKLNGIVEADETFCGGKPRKKVGYNRKRRGPDSNKTPVFAAVQRGGQVRVRVISNVTAKNIRQVIEETVDLENSTLMTDEHPSYVGIGKDFKGGHKSVKHTIWQYVDGDAHVNSAESFFAIVKRGLYGVFHSV